MTVFTSKAAQAFAMGAILVAFGASAAILTPAPEQPEESLSTGQETLVEETSYVTTGGAGLAEVIYAVKQDSQQSQIAEVDGTIYEVLQGCAAESEVDCAVRIYSPEGAEPVAVYSDFIARATEKGWTLTGESCTSMPLQFSPENPASTACEASSVDGKVQSAVFWSSETPTTGAYIPPADVLAFHNAMDAVASGME